MVGVDGLYMGVLAHVSKCGAKKVISVGVDGLDSFEGTTNSLIDQ